MFYFCFMNIKILKFYYLFIYNILYQLYGTFIFFAVNLFIYYYYAINLDIDLLFIDFKINKIKCIARLQCRTEAHMECQ